MQVNCLLCPIANVLLCRHTNKILSRGTFSSCYFPIPDEILLCSRMPLRKVLPEMGQRSITPTFLLRYAGVSGRHKEGRLYRVFFMPQNTPMANKFYNINLYSRKQDIKIFPESGFKTIINSKFG